ncbi:MAG: molecular chaperone DnaJ [Eubacteriaceae bacterium]|nr:molecular chaperone DnaJ [Eubacteriaceae bacterium]
MAKRDYYEVLGVAKNATDDEIKTAFRKLSIQFHPDHNPDDSAAEDRFKELNEAYSILKDPDSRAAYDRMGHAAFDQTRGGASPFGGGGFSGGFDFSDIFSDFFGGGLNPNRAQKGADLKVTITLTFEEAAYGCEKKLKVTRREKCSTCAGTGAAPGSGKVTCDKCNGAGQIRMTQQSMFGTVQTVQTCDKCGGTGEMVEEPCPQCQGGGFESVQRQIDIKVPAGVGDDSILPLRNEGNAGIRGGRNGDLYVYFYVKEHPIFRREGSDIYMNMPITFIQAALGDEVKVPTLEGSVKLKIPEGTQTGTTFKLRNKGVNSLNGYSKGSQYVTVDLEVPKKLTDKQKELLSEFGKMSVESHSQNKSFWEKVKELF